jgi:chromosome segregation ATPase
MQRIGRLALIAGIVAIVVLGLGYVWGAAGRGSAEQALEQARERLDGAEARALVLEARVNLYNMNFGDASRRLEEVKDPLRRMRQRYQELGNDQAARDIDAALERVDEAQRLAGKLDPAANSKAGDALNAIRAAASRQGNP